jgi:hypothetical protein
MAGPEISRDRFRRAGLLPDNLPHFPAGYNRGHELWIYLQDRDYYTRHLFLHEGTHAFMQWFLGSSGPPWYAEGMAEMLGLHRWQDGELELGFRPARREETEGWGRVKILREDNSGSHGLLIEQVLAIESSSFLDVRFYAWSWGLCEFFSNHVLTKSDFEGLANSVALPPERFQQRVIRMVSKHSQELKRDWELFIDEIEYGYDVRRGSLVRLPVELHDGVAELQLSVDTSWQVTEIEVSEGDSIEIRADGRFVVGREISNGNPERWECEPGGVTIDYYRGRPLGVLLAAILEPNQSADGLKNPIPIGLGRVFESPRAGCLCLRINESPARLADNEGSLRVGIKVVPRGRTNR